MSDKQESLKKATIKLAPKEASQRTGTGTADPGPGDPNAAPSEAPELVDIPNPPTSSQLVVKSTGQSKLPTMTPKSQSIGGSVAGPAASQPSIRESTSSRPLSSPRSIGSSAIDSTSAGKSGSGPAASGAFSKAPSSKKAASVTGPKPAESGSPATATPTASQAMNIDSNNVVHEDQVGETEIEEPQTPSSPASPRTLSQSMKSNNAASADATMDAAPPSTGGGVTKMSSKTSGKGPSTSSPSAGPSGPGADLDASSGASSKSHSHKHEHGGKKKKVTKFRYHKRITVRTSGKASPSMILDKVNKKEHNITPSTIEDMDPQELMRKAGIAGSKKTHWRVRLRQTKRTTKNGKTTTQTKVAYRDSDGNKRVKSSSNPYCKNCGKKLEECKCDSRS